MNRQQFWEIISHVDKAALDRDDQDSASDSVCTVLAKLDVDEIKSFSDHLAETLHDLDTAQHFSNCKHGTDDGFLYARCFVIAQGQQFYEKVLSSPKHMPSAHSSFELLLHTPQKSWSISGVNNLDDWEYRAPVSYETGTNIDGWPQTKHINSITFRDTADLCKALQQRSYSGSIALKFDEIGMAYAQELHWLEFETNKMEHLIVHLSTSEKCILETLEKSRNDTETCRVGIEPDWYVQASQRERNKFAVSLITKLLIESGRRDGFDVSKIEIVDRKLLKRC